MVTATATAPAVVPATPTVSQAPATSAAPAAEKPVICPEHVFCQVDVASKEEALDFLSRQGEVLGLAQSHEALLESFLAREELGSTGCVEGLAIPHAKCAAVTRPAVCLAKFAQPVEWGSLDGKPVTCAVALFVPGGQAGTTHLKLLSKIAVLTSQDEFGAFIGSTNDPAAISDYLLGHLS